MPPSNQQSSSYELVAQTVDGEGDQTKSTPLQRARWYSKLVPLCIFVPTCLSLVILILYLRQHKNSGRLYAWSTSKRATVQVVVHVLSSALAILWTWPICTMIGHWTRYRMSKKPVKLDTLRLWSAMTQSHMDWNLPWALALATLAFSSLTYLPATLWAGALTPSVTHALIPGMPLQVPNYDPKGFLWKHPQCWTKPQANGTFTNCLWRYQTGNLLRSIATATPPHGKPRIHSKWDNTRYQFVGRSYGVGAATGLMDDQITKLRNVQQYNYTELGLFAESNCTRNETADLRLEDERPYEAPFPFLYIARGALPNANWSYDPVANDIVGRDRCFQASFANSNQIVSIFTTWANDRWMLGIVTGWSYRQPNATQCEMSFKPRWFSINVSVVNATIHVKPEGFEEKRDPHPLYHTRNVLLDSYRLSQIMPSVFTSTVGEAFLENIRGLQVKENQITSFNSSDFRDDHEYIKLALAAVQDSVTAVMDDSLVALSSAALTFPNATQTVYATAKLAAVETESKPFIWAVVIVNMLGFIGVLVGFAFMWRADIPVFDYTDLGGIAFGILQGVVSSVMTRRFSEATTTHGTAIPRTEE